MRLRWFVLACWLLAPGSAYGIPLHEPFIGSGGTDLDLCPEVLESGPPAFALGCYIGNATDDRVFPLDFQAAGGWVLEKSTTTANQCASYKTGAMGAADNSCSFNNCNPGTGFCAANRLQEFLPLTFEIGTDTDVNRNGAPTCYYMWEEKQNYFGTVQYTGDGESTQAVDLEFTPDVIMVMNETSSLVTVLWTVDMPAGKSCYWDQGNAEGACHTTGVTAVSDSTMTVGALRNVDTIVYNAMYWKAAAGWVVTGTYTGDGSSGGGTQALVGDTQVVTATDCDVSYVMITGMTTDGLYAECEKQRGVNIGTGVTGPGNISAEPYAQMQQTVDEENGIQDLTDGSFTVTGAPTFEHSCNDLNVPYYWWASCAPVATPGSVLAADWSNSMLATWNMEALVATDIANEAAGCQDCTLTNRGDLIAVDAGDSLIATDSLLFDISDDTAATCDMDAPGCDELNNGTGDVSWACWVKSTSDSQNQAILSHGDMSYASSREITGNRLRCHVTDGGAVTATAADNSMLIDTWVLAGCTFDDSDDEIQAFVDGVASGSPATQSGTRVVTTGDLFNIGENPNVGTANFEGNMNECFVYDGELDAGEWCRIHACNLDGRNCSCFAADETIWVTTGRWDGSCTLPANCNSVP